MQPVGNAPVTATLAFTPVAWGTRLDLTCSYEHPAGDYHAPSSVTYGLFVVNRDGSIEQVGTWRALDGKTMRHHRRTAAQRKDIAGVEVRTSERSAGAPGSRRDRRWPAQRRKIPADGLGSKYVDLGGITSPRSATSMSWSSEGGRSAKSAPPSRSQASVRSARGDSAEAISRPGFPARRGRAAAR